MEHTSALYSFINKSQSMCTKERLIRPRILLALPTLPKICLSNLRLIRIVSTSEGSKEMSTENLNKSGDNQHDSTRNYADIADKDS